MSSEGGSAAGSRSLDGEGAGRDTSSEGRGRRGGMLRDLLGLLFSVVSLAAVAWWASNQEAPEFPTSASALLPLALALAVYATVTLVRGRRWHMILRRSAISHDPFDAYGLTVVAYMGNTVLPARGGELLRVLLLGERSDARRREILGSIVAERLLDIATLLLLLTLMTLAGVGDAAGTEAPVLIALAGVAVLAAALAVYVRLRRQGRLERFATAIRPFVRSSRLLWSGTGLFLLGVSALIWMLEALNFLLVARSLELAVSPLEAVFLVVLTSFVSAIPSAPGYLGTFDAALVFGLHAVGVESGDALAFVLLVRFIIFVPVTIAGLALMLVRYGGLSRLLRRA